MPILGTLSLIVVAFLGVSRWERMQQIQVLEKQGDEIAFRLQQRFNAASESVSALRRLIEVSPELSVTAFDHFARLTLSDHEEPEISALSFNPLVAGTQRAAFEAGQAKRLGIGDFSIRERNADGRLLPAGERERYVPAVLISPREGNAAAIGFDINSEPVRRDAIQRALTNGAPAATAAIQLVQDGEQGAGILMLHPTFAQSPGAAVRQLTGFAVGVLKIEAMIAGATHNAVLPGVRFNISDSGDSSGRLLFGAPSLGGEAWQGELHIADKRWLLSVMPDAGYAREHRSWVPSAVGVTGMLFVSVLQMLLLSMTGRAAVVERRVDEQTAELRTTDTALRRLLHEHESLLQRIPAGVFKLSLPAEGGYRYDYLSPQCCRQLGVTATEALENPRVVLDGIHPDDRLSFEEVQRHARKMQIGSLWEGRWLRHGEVRWLRHQAVPTLLENGDVIWEGVLTDITDLKQMELELRARMLEMQSILDNSSVGISFVRERKILWANHRMAEIFGYPDGGLANQSTRLFFPSEEEFMRFGETVFPVLLRGQRYSVERQMKHASGRLIWARLNGKLIDVTDPSAGAIWVFEDISEQKSVETELIAAKNAAEAANVAKSQFLATMSHEIRTPMNGILGMAQLALMPDMSEADREDCLRTLLDSCRVLQTLLNDILDLSRVEAGKVEIESCTFEPAAVMAEVKKLFHEPAAGKRLALTSVWHGAAAACYEGDPLRLRQMLSNLVGNSIKFTHEGEIRIEARAVPHDSPSAGVTWVEFSVVDSGIGISSEQLAKIFQPFSQADSSTTRKYGGTGLGLSIVRGLVEAMDGEIGVDSEPGVGSRFWFRIPLATSPVGGDAAGEVHASAPILSSGMRGRVLVVEDNQTNRKVIVSMLSRLGLSVDLAENGQEALTCVTQGEPYDLLLMDVQMPVMDGQEAAWRIRRWETSAGRPPVPIVALTASAFEEDRKRCLAAGMNDFLPKPVDFEALQTVLAEWLPVSATKGAASEQNLAAPEAIGKVFNAPTMLARIGGDLDLGRSLVDVAVVEIAAQLEVLRRAVAEGKREDALRAAHAIKGMALDVEASTLVQRAKALEELLRAGGEAAPGQVEALDDAFGLLKRCIGDWLAQIG